MYDLPTNTMFNFLSNPMFDSHNYSELPVSKLAKEIDTFMAKNKNHPAPETDALTFYLLNHGFHVMKTKFNQLEALNSDMIEVAEQHIAMTNRVAKRLFCYSTIIAVEEARFMHDQDDIFYDFLKREYGEDFLNYVKNGFSVGSDHKLTSFGKLDMTCGEFFDGMVSVFAFGKWQGGFGGKGWVGIASLMADVIKGSISLENMADQAFSLCHNNGSMFNKGHLYQYYSSFIYDILDIQDSGQIPLWIDNNKSSKFITAELKKVHTILSEYFPNEMTGKIDQSIIKNSKQKREQKAAMIAKKNQANWNSGFAGNGSSKKTEKTAPTSKIDTLLSGDFKNNGWI